MQRGFQIALTACLALAGCAAPVPDRTPTGPAVPLEWRRVATEHDRDRLRAWRPAFTGAIGAARRGGHGAEIDREGALLVPDAALGGGPIPNGDYHCRVIKLGAKSEGMLDYVTYPAFRCRVATQGHTQSFIKLTGSQRQVGIIYPNDAMRQVFLGTIVLGDEQGALLYGQDQMRDVAGYIERIGPDRWRMVMPRPHYESQTDVLELRPIR